MGFGGLGFKVRFLGLGARLQGLGFHSYPRRVAKLLGTPASPVLCERLRDLNTPVSPKPLNKGMYRKLQ